MAVDYLVASLQPLSLDAPAPYQAEAFCALCEGQLTPSDMRAVKALLTEDESPDVPRAWRELATHLRNALVQARAQAHGGEATPFLKTPATCSIYWTQRLTAAYQEKEILTRARALDQVWWDAAGELTSALNPLSVGAVFTYAIRLKLIWQREQISLEKGQAVLDHLLNQAQITL